MEDQERKAVIDQMGAAVASYMAATKARNLPGASFAMAAMISGVGLLAQELVELTEELSQAS